MIGMCVLDFIYWSIKSPEFDSEIATHLTNTSALWDPFMNFLIGSILTLVCLLQVLVISKIQKLELY